MFSISDIDFMTNNMRIDVASIESKLNEPFFTKFKSIAVDAIAKYIEVIKAFEVLAIKRDLFSHIDNEAEEFIRSHYCNLADMIEDEAVLQVFDTLRYSFSCYAYNGLHQLYTRQENQNWHPKIKLIEILEPNDIESLESMIKIYRGCDITEHEKGSYGQAWTTSLETAKEFAFIHYQNQDWFLSGNRVVLETNYYREHLLFSNQSVEFEVVVNTSRLVNVRKHI